MVARLSTDSFIIKANNVHNNKYDYSEVKYINARTNVIIICKQHGSFLQLPINHFAGNGCPVCKRIKDTSTTEQFIIKAESVHDGLYDYTQVDYVKCNLKVIIICKIHGNFLQTPTNHLMGDGCPKCGVKQLSTELFIYKASELHKGLYDYALCCYITHHTKVNIICKIHGVFSQKPCIHLRGAGCPKCALQGHSSVCIEWLECIMNYDDIFIQHKLNIGEYVIPNTKYRVDGYCKATNTVYEFHGDCFHGNPNIYLPDVACSPFSTHTASELFQKTIDREQIIKNLGYRLVIMWGTDYNKLRTQARCIFNIIKGR